MKRDMDLVRQLLIEIESIPPGAVYATGQTSITSHERETLDAHLRLIDDAGFITDFASDGTEAWCTGLTWQGHEFLDAARSQTVWAKAKARLRKAGVTVSTDVLIALLTSVARDELGLS